MVRAICLELGIWNLDLFEPATTRWDFRPVLRSMSMDKRIYQLHAELCSTMANPIRLEIIDLLRETERSVGELADLAGVSQANMSQHLTFMRQRGIVAGRRQGTTVYYKLANPKMLEAFDILREILFEQLQGDQAIIKRFRLAQTKTGEGRT